MEYFITTVYLIATNVSMQLGIYVFPLRNPNAMYVLTLLPITRTSSNGCRIFFQPVASVTLC